MDQSGGLRRPVSLSRLAVIRLDAQYLRRSPIHPSLVTSPFRCSIPNSCAPIRPRWPPISHVVDLFSTSSDLNSLEESRKKWQVRADELRNERNMHAKTVGKAKAQGQDIAPLLKQVEALGADLAQAEGELAKVQADLEQMTLGLPNMLHEGVPDGRDESANVEIRRWGEPRKFDFKPRDHVELGEKLGQMDFAAAGRISGARFTVLTGPLARLQRALIQFMLDLHTSEHGYREAYVPYLVNAPSLLGTGNLPKFEADLFALKGESGLYLIPTAEVPVTNLVRETIVEAEALPLRFAAHTPCFRSEAGSYGKDTRGMIRQHQFEKVELVHLVRPQDSLRRTRSAHTQRRGSVEAVESAVSGGRAVRGRRRIWFGEDLRSGSVAARTECVPGNFLVLQLRGLPGPSHASALAQSGNRKTGAAAHAERLRRRGGPRARCGARKLSAGRRQHRRAGRVAPVHGGKGSDYRLTGQLVNWLTGQGALRRKRALHPQRPFFFLASKPVAGWPVDRVQSSPDAAPSRCSRLVKRL